MSLETTTQVNPQAANPKHKVFQEIASIIGESFKDAPTKPRQVRGGGTAEVLEKVELSPENRKLIKQIMRRESWTMDVASGEELAVDIPAEAATKLAEIEAEERAIEKKRQALYNEFPKLRENKPYNDQSVALLEGAFKAMTGGALAGGVLDTCKFFTGVDYRPKKDGVEVSTNGSASGDDTEEESAG